MQYAPSRSLTRTSYSRIPGHSIYKTPYTVSPSINPTLHGLQSALFHVIFFRTRPTNFSLMIPRSPFDQCLVPDWVPCRSLVPSFPLATKPEAMRVLIASFYFISVWLVTAARSLSQRPLSCSRPRLLRGLIVHKHLPLVSQ
jgi:hypothetical protein